MGYLPYMVLQHWRVPETTISQIIAQEFKKDEQMAHIVDKRPLESDCRLDV